MTAKTKVPVRAWAYRIWTLDGNDILFTLPSDGAKLEALIAEHGELVIAVAWGVYVTADPPMYHTSSVQRYVEAETKQGKKYLAYGEDETPITRFPLASFLAVPDGCIFKATEQLADLAKWKKQKHDPTRDIVLAAMAGKSTVKFA